MEGVAPTTPVRSGASGDEIRGPEIAVAIATPVSVSTEAAAAAPSYVVPVAIATPVMEPDAMRMARGTVIIAQAVRVTNDPPAARRRTVNDFPRNRVMPVDGTHKVFLLCCLWSWLLKFLLIAAR
jgi:hypothetical protein